MGSLTYSITMLTFEWFTIEGGNGHVLDICNCEHGASLILHPKHGGDNQLWKFENGLLVSKTGLVADIEGGSTEQGAKVIAWDKHGGINQQFSCYPTGVIMSNATGHALEVSSGTLVMMPQNGGENQKFRFVVAS